MNYTTTNVAHYKCPHCGELHLAENIKIGQRLRCGEWEGERVTATWAGGFNTYDDDTIEFFGLLEANDA